MSTYYLSDVSVRDGCDGKPPDYTVYRWLNTSSVSELKEVSKAEKMTAKVGVMGACDSGVASLLVPEGDSERDVSPLVVPSVGIDRIRVDSLWFEQCVDDCNPNGVG